MFKGIALLFIVVIIIAALLVISVAGISGIAWLVCWAFGITFAWSWKLSACVLAAMAVISIILKSLEEK